MERMSWEEIVTQETIEWLLGPENPSVRYWTLRHLEDRTPTDSEVLEAQDVVMETSCVKTILKNQKAEGHWEKHENMYLPKYRATTHNLLILAELGAKRIPEIEKAVEHIYERHFA